MHLERITNAEIVGARSHASSNETIPDNELRERDGVKEGEFEYFKYITIDAVRYVLYIQRDSENASGEAEIHFALADSFGDPITNFGLKTFGKIATEIEKMYQEVTKVEQINQLKIRASKNNHSFLEEQYVKKLSRKDLRSLDGFKFTDKNLEVDIEIHDQVVSVVYRKKHKTFNLSSQLVTDLEAISSDVDLQLLIPELVRYLNHGRGDNQAVSEKELQRLKLYQFYFHKRFPQFTFNSKVVVGENGKRDIEFEKDGDGNPYLIVFTDSSGNENTNREELA